MRGSVFHFTLACTKYIANPVPETRASILSPYLKPVCFQPTLLEQVAEGPGTAGVPAQALQSIDRLGIQP